MAQRPHPSPPGSPHRDPPADGGPTPSPSTGLAQVAVIVLGEQPLGQVLEHVAEVTAATVPGAGEVSVILVEGARARSAGFSGPPSPLRWTSGSTRRGSAPASTRRAPARS